MYPIQRPSRSEFTTIRSLPYHVRQWGQPRPGQPLLVLLHGWMDIAASYQFMVDAMAQDRHIVAPDWRGFGLTDNGGADSFWFPDYLADLDFLLNHYAPSQPVDMVGHSMGGHVAMLYAGIRPERIHRLVNLEGFGMPATQPSQAAGRFAQWMDGLYRLQQGEMDLKTYPNQHGVAHRLMKNNPRLPQDKANWLAQHWSRPTIQNDGTRPWQILGNPAHKLPNAQLFRLDEVLAVYQCITAPTLSVEASSNSLARWSPDYTLAQYHERLQSVPNATVAVMQDAGHMLHHDQPELLAQLVEDFLAK